MALNPWYTFGRTAKDDEQSKSTSQQDSQQTATVTIPVETAETTWNWAEDTSENVVSVPESQNKGLNLEGLAASAAWPPVMNEPLSSIDLAYDGDEALTQPVDEVVSLPVSMDTSVFEPVTLLEDQPVGSPRLTMIRHALEDARKALNKAIDLLREEEGGGSISRGLTDIATILQEAGGIVSPAIPRSTPDTTPEGGRVLEGIFDGQNMVGADGKQYSVPANYASKSKLVEGDLLKLTITPQGTFIYKQIKPIERHRIVAKLEQHPETREFIAHLDGRRWKILTASVTYFKGAPGDEVIIVVPQGGASRWAAVENIIKAVF